MCMYVADIVVCSFDQYATCNRMFLSPRAQDECEEFMSLCSFLKLAPDVKLQYGNGGDLQLNSTSCVRWMCDDVATLLGTWCGQLVEFTARAQSTARVLLYC